MNKPNKVFLHNTSLIMALAEGLPNKGNIRKTFFYTQLMGAGHGITHPKAGDFLIDNRYTIEIGGRTTGGKQTKGGKQIEKIQDAYLAIDDLEYGTARKIPLWLFGLLY